MKKLISVVLVLIVGLSIAGCGNQSVQGSSKKTYLIATDATYAPFEFQQGGKYVGIDIDILNAISKVEGFNFELKPMDFNGIIPALESNQIDGTISGMSITSAREQVMDFSNGYYNSGLVAIASKDNNKINSLSDLNGKTFAVKKGTFGATYAEQNKGKYNAEIRYFNDTPSMFQEVEDGNADVTFEDYPVIAYELSVDSSMKLKIVGDKLSHSLYGFAVKKGTNQELLKQFNDGLAKIKANGEYDKIIAKYIKK